MISLVADADDKEGLKTKIIGLYVPSRFEDTTNKPHHDTPEKVP